MYVSSANRRVLCDEVCMSKRASAPKRIFSPSSTTIAPDPMFRETGKRRRRERDLLKLDALLNREQQARVRAESAKERMSLLSEITTVLNASLDYQSSLQMLPQLIVPRLADMCIVWVLEENGKTITPLAASHAKRDLIASFYNLISRYPMEISRQEGVGKAIRTGRSLLYKQIPDSVAMGFAKDEQHWKEMMKNRSKSYMAVPLKARGHTLGAISFMTAEWGREYEESDLDFAEELAARVSVVLDNTRLYSSLKASYAEKQTLLEELHHRVKNNLQVISSLLSLEAGTLTNPEALKAFDESQKRIRTLALLHEKLYSASNLTNIDLSDYLRSLAQSLVGTYQAGRRQKIALIVRTQKITVGIQQALPIGLIVNEIITNSFKYAFPEQTAGKISLRLQRENGGFVLIVSDNGTGLPEKMCLDHEQTLGSKLIQILTNQIEGKVDIISGPTKGTRYEINCPLKPR